MRQRGNEDAVSSEAWLEQTLDEILARVRELLGVTGCAFQVVDWERGQIRPAAAWFADEETRQALDAVLTRPYDPERGGVTEAAIESGRPLLIDSVAEWAGAERLHHRLCDQLDPEAAARAWAWYEGSSYISCPVRTAEGRTLGVLAISRAHPRPALTTEDLRVVEVFADLAALALERARQAREQEVLNRASRAVSRLLEPEAVYRATVEQALLLTGAPKGFLARFEPATEELRVVASSGFTGEVMRTRFRVGEGMIGRAAASGEPYLSDASDADRYLSEFVTRERVESFVHIPITLGPRLFGVLNLSSDRPGWFDAGAARPRRRVRPRRGRRDRQRTPLPARAAGGPRAHARLRPRAGAVAARPADRARLRARRPRRRRRRHLRRVDDAERRVRRPHRRRERKGPRGRRAQLDGALLRRGAHVGLREPGRGARPDRGAAAPPAAERELCVGVHERHRRWAPAVRERRARIDTAPLRGGRRAGADRDRAPARRPGRRLGREGAPVRGRRRAVRRHRRARRGAPRGRVLRRRATARPARRARAPARPGGARRARAPRGSRRGRPSSTTTS